jgi:lipoprotein-anchoring transpeptidase ErfK/SrfK
MLLSGQNLTWWRLDSGPCCADTQGVSPASPLPTTARARRSGRVVVGLVAGALALSGCSVGQLGVHAGDARDSSSARISLSPTRTKAIVPSAPVVVSVASGRLTDVVVEGPGGAPVPGQLSVDGHTWTSESGVLDYDASYSVSAEAVDRSGLPANLHTILHTVAPSSFLGLSVAPHDGAQVGVGMPITVTLDHKLSSQGARTAFEKHVGVTVDGAPAGGSWRWLTDKVVVYRTPTYWPGNATVAVKADVKGVKFTGSVWGEQNQTTTFRTGPAMVSYVDMQTDMMKVTRDGKLVKVIPITTGKPGFESRSGVKVIMNKERTRIMDAATGGTAKTDPEYYRLQVEYAMRLTWSGEFLHAAPWSVAHQGHENVSHGCTGMSTANAAWLYANSEIGDVVVYTGHDKPIEAGNGITVWNTFWAKWQNYSVLTA